MELIKEKSLTDPSKATSWGRRITPTLGFDEIIAKLKEPVNVSDQLLQEAEDHHPMASLTINAQGQRTSLGKTVDRVR